MKSVSLRSGSWLAAAAIILAAASPAASQEAKTAAPDLRAGHGFIATPVYTAEEDQQVLAMFEGLRVSDVADGMDRAGLKNVGLVSPEIRPLWRDTEHFKHRFVGIAVTARYVPTNRAPAPETESVKEFDSWVGKWYGELSSEPFTSLLRPGSALVIDDAASADVGTIGSNNILGWVSRGCVGVVTNAGARDTDEIITEKVPLYFKDVGRGIRPGRNEIESVNRPVVVGGATVVPGDVIVADGDGVVVVPRRVAKQVADYARETLDKDKAGRRKLYERLGLPADDSVK